MVTYYSQDDMPTFYGVCKLLRIGDKFDVRFTLYFGEQRGSMREWADYLSKVEAGTEIIPLRA